MKEKPPFLMQLIMKNGYASHTKLMSLVGAAIASFIMIYEATHARMNSDYFWAYLGILVAGNAASKFIDSKEVKKNEPVPTLPKK